MRRRPPRSTRTDTLFPYTTLFRSCCFPYDKFRGEAMDGCDEGTAEALIRTLDLAPHPEGGWFRETWRAAAVPGERAGGTALYFLLEAHQRAHWHRVDAEEHLFWHVGAPLGISIADQGGAGRNLHPGDRKSVGRGKRGADRV